ncbi:MAG: hypothetical protein ACI8XM_000885 [Haloarculaceae archaeon]|jgi:hypothetical protein
MHLGIHCVDTEVVHMSSPPITDLPSLPAAGVERSLLELLLVPMHRAAFWAAIALPFLHLPLLATGLDSETKTIAFALLIALNVVALVVGHPDHR